MNHKRIGIVLLIITLILAAIFVVYKISVEQYIKSQMTTGPQGECIHPTGTECPYETLNKLQPYNYVLIAVILILFIVGIYLVFLEPKKEVEEKEEVKLTKKPKDLSEEEKNIYDIIVESQGSVFQSDLVKKTQWSKVRVTRVLDKLEGKGLIERRRRGMTNVVLLK